MLVGIIKNIDMAQQTTYTIKQMHELFHQFLMGKFEGDMSETNVIVETAEEVLPFTLNDHLAQAMALSTNSRMKAR